MNPPDVTDRSTFWPSDPEAFLTQGEITACQLLPWGSNCVYAVAICWHGEEGIGIYKPRSGEEPLWDFPSGTLYRREHAAYLVARALGWNFIPPTYIREGPHGIGSIQLYRDPAGQSLSRVADRFQAELLRFAVFDVITNNADRKAAHFLIGKDGRLWGIDHGLTFNEAYRLRTVLWQLTGKPVPNETLLPVRALVENPGDLNDQLAPLLTDVEIDTFWERCRRLLERPIFPRPIPYGYPGFF